MDILEVPDTLNNPFGEKFPRPILHLINPIKKPQTILINFLIGKRRSSTWLRPSYSTTEEMLSVTEHLYQKASTDTLVLCMMFHSNEATEGMSPYNLSEDDVDRFLQSLRGYFELLFSSYKVQPVGLSDIKRSL